MTDSIITAISPALSSLHLAISGVNSGNSNSNNKRHLHRRTQSQFDFKTQTQSDNSETISPAPQTPPPLTAGTIPSLTPPPVVFTQLGYASNTMQQGALNDFHSAMHNSIPSIVGANILQHSPQSQIFFNSQITPPSASTLPQAQLEQQNALIAMNSNRQKQEMELSKQGEFSSSCNSDLHKLEDHMQEKNARILENEASTQEFQQQQQLLEYQSAQQPLTTQQMIEYMQQKQVDSKQQIIETIDEDFSRFISSNSSNCFQFGKKRLRNDHFESVSTSQTALSHLAEQLSLQHLEKGTPVLQTIPEQEIISSEYQAISHPGSTRHNEETTASKKGIFFSDQLQEQEQYSAHKSLLKSGTNEGVVDNHHSTIESSPLLSAQSAETQQSIKYSTSAGGFYVAPFDTESGLVGAAATSLSPAFFSSSPSKLAVMSSSSSSAAAGGGGVVSMSEKRYFPSVKKQQQKQMNIIQQLPIQPQQQSQQQLIQSLKNITSSGQVQDQVVQSQQQQQQQQQQQSHRKQCSLSDEMEGSLKCLQAQFAQLQRQQQQQQQTNLAAGKTLSVLKNRPPNQQTQHEQDSVSIKQSSAQQLLKKKQFQNSNNNNANSQQSLQLSQSPQPLLKKPSHQQQHQNSSQLMSNSLVIASSSLSSSAASNKVPICSSCISTNNNNNNNNNRTNLTLPYSSSSPQQQQQSQQYFHYQLNSPLPQHPASCTACYSDRPPCTLNRTRQTNSDRRYDSVESSNLLNHTFIAETNHSQNVNNNNNPNHEQSRQQQQTNHFPLKDSSVNIKDHNGNSKSSSNRSTQGPTKNADVVVVVAAAGPAAKTSNQLPHSDRTNNIASSTSIVNANNSLFYSQTQYARKKPAKNAHSSSSTAISNYTINTNTKADNSCNSNSSHDQIRQFINQIAGSSKKSHQSPTAPVTTAFLADINTSIKKIQGAHQRKASAGTTTTMTTTTTIEPSCPTGGSSLLFPFSSTSVTPNSFCISAPPPPPAQQEDKSHELLLLSGQSQLCHSAGSLKHQTPMTNILKNFMPFPSQQPSDSHNDNSEKINQEDYQEYQHEQSRKTVNQQENILKFEELRKLVFILLERINQLESSNAFLLSSMGQLIKDKEIDKKQLQKIDNQTQSNQKTIAALSKLLASRNSQPKPESDTRINTDYSSSESPADALQSKFQAKDSLFFSSIEPSSSTSYNPTLKHPNSNNNKHSNNNNNNNSSNLLSLFERLSAEQQHCQNLSSKQQQQQYYQLDSTQQYPAVGRAPQTGGPTTTTTQIQKYLQKDQTAKPSQSSPLPYYQISTSPLQKAAASSSSEPPSGLSSSSPAKIIWQQQSPQQQLLLSAASQREDIPDWQMEDSSRSSERQEQQHQQQYQQQLLHSQDPLLQATSCSNKNNHIMQSADQPSHIHSAIFSQPQLKMNKSVSQPNCNNINHKNTNPLTSSSNSYVSAFAYPQSTQAQQHQEQSSLTRHLQSLQKQFAAVVSEASQH